MTSRPCVWITLVAGSARPRSCSKVPTEYTCPLRNATESASARPNTRPPARRVSIIGTRLDQDRTWSTHQNVHREPAADQQLPPILFGAFPPAQQHQHVQIQQQRRVGLGRLWQHLLQDKQPPGRGHG